MASGAVLTVLAIVLVQLTGPDGMQRIDVNPAEVTSVREPRGVKQGHWGPGTRCLVVMTSGKFIAVSEDCDEVRRQLGPQQGKAPCTFVCGSERP